jgi:hypothetical protein
LILANYDGVVAILANMVDALFRTSRKPSKENGTRSELLKGAYLSDVYAKYGAL